MHDLRLLFLNGLFYLLDNNYTASNVANYAFEFYLDHRITDAKLAYVIDYLSGIDALLAMITRTEVEDDYDPDEDDYNNPNPNIPFPDDTLDSFIKYPKRISIIPENRLAIYLKKMELSEKGREVLTKLREQDLIK
ncbi:hypothetical protein [Gilliamella sp. B2838]|uniref:hypothetical protein n=2 Tax=Gilliamella TaxID=1193503 RepID=UPI002269CD13|nr:hypothetical protein [Gilliamella sp. B2838]MCX8727237.1 hypothetical protein [Gilliamella sp. B2838]